MLFYISCHPLDSYFATELLVHLKNIGFAAKVSCSNCNNIILKDDALIAVLRPEYIKSSIYAQISEKFNNNTVFPVLRAPISVDDWNRNVVLNPIADFTSHNVKEILSNLEVLSDIILSWYGVSKVTKPTPQEMYINTLEVTLKEYYLPADLLETNNYECDCNSVSENPILTLLSKTLFRVISKEEEGFITSTYTQHPTEYLENIAKYHRSYTVICDHLDCRLVAAFLGGVMRQQYIDSGGKSPIPILIDIEAWDKEIPSSTWLGEQIKFTDTPVEDIETGKLALFVYGFEHSSMNERQFREIFNQWQDYKSPPPYLVMMHTYLNLSEYALCDTVIRPAECDLKQLKQVFSNYSSRPFAQFILTCVDNDENIPWLNYLVRNPIFSANLLSVQFEQGIEFSQQSINNYFRDFVGNLWKLGNDKHKVDISELNDALSRIAAIVTERQQSFIRYDEVLKFIQPKSLLHQCIDVGLVSHKEDKICFSMGVIQDYFAAIAIAKYGIPPHLSQLILSDQSNRVPQRWDNPIIISSHILSSADVMLRQIADIDPMLALACIVSGPRVKAPIYSYVIEKNLDALDDIGDFRTDFAKLLRIIDPATAKSILVEVLRNAHWSVRMYAYRTFLELYTSSMSGLAESLINIDKNTRTGVAQAIRRIGSDGLSTLFQLIHHDNVITRLNAIWAFSELGDKASVPALVEILTDNNVTVSTQVSSTLGILQDIQSVPYLIKHLQHRHTNTRRAVINALTAIHNSQPEQFAALIRRMDTATRRLVVVCLSTTKTNTLTDFLLAFTYDENVDIRIAAIKGLATNAEPRVISRLEECLEDMTKSRLSKSSVSEIVSKLLSNISQHDSQTVISADNHDSAKPDFTKPLNSSQIVKARLLNQREQRTAINKSISDDISHAEVQQSNVIEDTLRDSRIIVLATEDAYVSNALAQLRNRKWQTSSNVAKTLRDYVRNLRGNSSSKAVNQILETLNDDDWVIRWTGVETLGWIGNIHVVPHLIQRLADPNWKVRVSAIRALTEIKDNTAINGLSALVSDDNAIVREAAAEAIGFLNGKQAIHILETAALDGEDFVRLAAVESLGRIRDKVAAQALLSALKDSSEHVRWAAANGLVGIADSSIVSSLASSLSDTGGPYWEQKRICDLIVDILKQIGTEESKKVLLDWQTNRT